MADEQRDLGSLLGNGASFEGKLTFIGTVRVEGEIEGEVFSEDTLVVAAGGEVRGAIDVGTLIVTGGVVKGNVRAHQSVELHPGGTLVGEVVSPVFQIERGAVFQGNCTMPEDAAPEVEEDSEAD